MHTCPYCTSGRIFQFPLREAIPSYCSASSADTLHYQWSLFSAAAAAFETAVDASLASMARASLFSAAPSLTVSENLIKGQKVNGSVTYRNMTYVGTQILLHLVSVELMVVKKIKLKPNPSISQ